MRLASLGAGDRAAHGNRRGEGAPGVKEWKWWGEGEADEREEG